MLRPDYLQGLPDALVSLYARAEADILADMARRISTYDFWIPAAEHQRKALIEMGTEHDYIMQRLSKLTGKTKSELQQLFRDAGHDTLDTDNEIYRAAGLTPPKLDTSKELQKVLQAGLKKTRGLFTNLTRTTANTASKQFENALDRAYMQITSGAFDSNTAIRMAIKDLSKQGVGTIRYPSGRVDTIETAVRRAVVTGVNQTALQLQDTLADEMDSDLVETTAHAGARPEHAEWQGKIFSRSGKHPKYPDFRKKTGYGTGAGLGGWNCRHSFFPYFEGSPRAYTEEMLRDFEAKKYTYNGQKLTEYEATQTQRHIERQIRRWKREYSAMAAAGLDTGEAAAKISQWQKEQRGFIAQTGLKRQYDREQSAKFGKAEASAVRRELAKYTRYRYNEDGTIVVTDDWTGKEHPKLAAIYQPFAVIDTVSQKGKQRDRMYYDASGRQLKQISNGPHGNPKKHPYGKNGEHAHDIEWKDGKIAGRTVRELTEQERKENADIL